MAKKEWNKIFPKKTRNSGNKLLWVTFMIIPKLCWNSSKWQFHINSQFPINQFHILRCLRCDSPMPSAQTSSQYSNSSHRIRLRWKSFLSSCHKTVLIVLVEFTWSHSLNSKATIMITTKTRTNQSADIALDLDLRVRSGYNCNYSIFAFAILFFRENKKQNDKNK